MKRYLCILLTGIIFTFLLSACAGREIDPGDVFVPETDRPLSSFKNPSSRQGMAAGEDGYYFYVENFLFYADRENWKVVPLCNRPDCRHFEEESNLEFWKCNAFMGNGVTAPFLQFYEGKLYAMSYFNAEAPVDKEERQLVELSPDGSSRKRLLEMPLDIQLFLHRGYLYYLERSGAENMRFKRRPLSDLNAEPELIYEGKEISSPFAYGNHIYIEDRKYDQEKQIGFKQLYQYNIQTGEIAPIVVGDDDSGRYLDVRLRSVTEDGRLVISSYHPESMDYNAETGEVYDYGDMGSVYLTDLNGQLIEQLPDGKDGYPSQILMDENYIYRYFNDFDSRMLRIHDLEMNPVAEVGSEQIGSITDSMVSDSRYLFHCCLGYPDRTSYLECFVLDKSAIPEGRAEWELIYSFDSDQLLHPLVWYHE